MTDVREENEAREEDGDHCKGIAMSNGQGRCHKGDLKEAYVSDKDSPHLTPVS